MATKFGSDNENNLSLFMSFVMMLLLIVELFRSNSDNQGPFWGIAVLTMAFCVVMNCAYDKGMIHKFTFLWVMFSLGTSFALGAWSCVQGGLLLKLLVDNDLLSTFQVYIGIGVLSIISGLVFLHRASYELYYFKRNMMWEEAEKKKDDEETPKDKVKSAGEAEEVRGETVGGETVGMTVVNEYDTGDQ